MTSPPPLELNYQPILPQQRDLPIGCIGSGFIMADCHLVAYAAAGFNPVAIASRTPSHAAEVAQRQRDVFEPGLRVGVAVQREVGPAGGQPAHDVRRSGRVRGGVGRVAAGVIAFRQVADGAVLLFTGLRAHVLLCVGA